MEQLGIDTIQLLLQVVNFSIMVFLLAKFLYKPVLKMLQERKREIKEGLRMTEEAKEKLEDIENKKAKVLNKAQKEAKRIVDDARKSGKKLEAEIIKEAEGKARRIIEQKKKDLQIERVEMERHLRRQTIDIATAMTEKVLKEVLSEIDHKKIIDKKIRAIAKLRK